jgi:hypothetical protein
VIQYFQGYEMKNKVTIDDLADMVQRGFLDQSKQIQEIRNDIQSVKKDVSDFKNENQEDHKESFNSLNRVETLQKSELNRADKQAVILDTHGKRLTALETK